MFRLLTASALVSLSLATPSPGQEITLSPTAVTEWKAVYGRIESRDRLPARARLGGTLVSLTVTEGDTVEAGQVLAQIVDDKIGFQLSAIDAQLDALRAQFDNARTELTRGEDLLSRGVTTVQRLDQLRTQVDVLSGQIAAQEAQRKVLEQQAAEGAVLAPVSGRVLDVPVAAGAVVMPGEAVATIGGGGTFLRLAVPERHATFLKEGDAIGIETAEGEGSGKLARIYPQIENGRVVADVEVEGLSDAFVDARVLVRLPVAEREALLVPADAVRSHSGLDMVAVRSGDAILTRAVVIGAAHEAEGNAMVEVLSGLVAGDVVVTDHE
ncbi:efflux RND transporter periplasmic adaptor subunit [Aliigemmobacter aestuarii]|uniref:Efflux RND transporter periplasmic adaptor subunit n=1 Tax=Aliigemmobacter aestuarii TaxID=1445661 RepID=A0A4S3MR13_9RHOB|nr:efflux RND transporter periplasmic adaptor subunit [Gemmobacter aestuarii]THD84980.1 efflux RND transporter periplasmic adaptor subunit [Gemmobacter aestuarii]